ncbi:hypothetical protein PF008_g5368 [Phytophthora fragariae]|uniref:Uncharacterized protein n=1 Tax=Phytophthora fragariae TaxID=53985 RepID=A0A6G0S8J6_9STRA|nr:hypothetical protein PF008_g5368 [Phytophthora fragariae]
MSGLSLRCIARAASFTGLAVGVAPTLSFHTNIKVETLLDTSTSESFFSTCIFDFSLIFSMTNSQVFTRTPDESS